MITPESAPVLVRISLVLVLVSAAFLLSSRNLPNLVRIYQLQSLLLVIIAVFLAGIEDHGLLFLEARLTFISKVWCITLYQDDTTADPDTPGYQVLISSSGRCPDGEYPDNSPGIHLFLQDS
jgi:hypothetical protein